MNIQHAYDQWSEQYDTNENKTRDLEGRALRETVDKLDFQICLELGCGTGKNTEWLVSRAREIVAVDLSAEMLAKARMKVNSDAVRFVQADINEDWKFGVNKFDLITLSLLLEHIENLEPVFRKAFTALKPGGHLYLGELHPFKQYLGSKARFETTQGVQTVTCYNHHLSDFTAAGQNCGFLIEQIKEYFDNNDHAGIPRILTIVFKKPN
ncbi:MAG: class I SAM-dependent methyltransferase [Flavisolibacter sp.]